MRRTEIPRKLSVSLWPHQKKAINHAIKYLRAPKSSKTPTVLVRMPTGSGKTGVIAVLSIAIPPQTWTLILTPWSNLCDQMIKDLIDRFWKRVGWEPDQMPSLFRLYPSNIDEVLAGQSTQLVIVSTFATLVTIFKQHKDKHQQLSEKLSQVIVDEGHYEPAVEWGQAVKQLRTPTLLLTATPYRNDLKLFRVSANDVFHYTHEQAESDGIIRRPEFQKIGVPEPKDLELNPWCDAFATFWKQKKSQQKQARAIICCARMATVERVTRFLRHRGLEAIGIHERFSDRREDWLVQKTPDPQKTVKYDVWIHQNKLTEGLDDYRFCVLGLLNRIRNERKLIQQIGRVLRRGPNRAIKALILYSDSLSVESSWKNYREFEKQEQFVDPERYRDILKEFLNKQPSMEYFGRRFRRRFDVDSPEIRDQVLLRASAVVRKLEKSFVVKEFTDFTSDFLLLKDRILLGANAEAIADPSNARLWVYAVFSNSNLLIEHSQYEIRLGAMAAVIHGRLLFLVDTEATYPSEYLSQHTRKLTRDELGRVLGQKIVPKEVALTNPWPVGPMVRRSLIYSDDLHNTPAQLTDAVFVCSAIRATSLPESIRSRKRRHYIGFHRGRISEQIRSNQKEAFSLIELIEWTKRLSALITAESNRVSEFFHRYLSPVPPPVTVQPNYLVFNLFEGDVDLQDEDGESIELVESIVRVGAEIDSNSNDLRFPCQIRFRHCDNNDSNGDQIAECILSYNPSSARFRIGGEELNSNILLNDEETEEAEGFTTYLNKNDEAFTVVLHGSELYYTAQAFYQVDYQYAELRLESILTSVPALKATDSEKGTPTRKSTKWSPSSVFGVVSNLGKKSLLAREFGNFDLLVCDDLGKEVADFVCVNFTSPKVALIHAKDSKGRIVSASALQEVVAQAMKNLNVLSRGGVKPAHIDRWNRHELWPGTKIHRWLKGKKSLPITEKLWEKIRTDIIDHPHGSKEVWLVVGRTLEKEVLMKQLLGIQKRDEVTGHVVQLLSTLNAACTQIGVKLKIFCH